MDATGTELPHAVYAAVRCSNADGLVFQYNPATDDGRTSGSAASLVGLATAADGEEQDQAARALRLAHALVLGWGGIPVIWSGDELGQPNDPHWADEPGHEDDNRWAHRPRLDRERHDARHDLSTTAGRVFDDLRGLIRVRTTLPHLHGSIESRIGPVDDPGVLVTVREHPLGTFVGLHNVTSTWRSWPGHTRPRLRVDAARDELTGAPLTWGEDGNVWLEPYAVVWLTS